MAEEKLDTQVRRQQIAEAAMSLVASQGLRRLSVAAVARRVGLVPSGIYRHFKNKDELLGAVIDRVEERLLGNVEAARQESDDPLEQLKGVLMRHIRFIREGRAVPRIIFADDVHAGSPERRQRVLQVFSRYAAAIGEIVRQGQSQGRIRQDVRPANARHDALRDHRAGGNPLAPDRGRVRRDAARPAGVAVVPGRRHK